MYSPLRHLGSIFRKKRPIQLTFFVTSRCNSRCPFCFYLQRKPEGKESKPKPELSLEEIERVSGSMGSLLWVLFSGGEPYLRGDIVEISRTFYDNNKPWMLTIPTNALLPKRIRDKTEEILEYCRKSVVAVKLSLDALYEEHDSLRGVKGNFERVIETYNQLSPLLEEYPNFELGINTVFCSVNQDKIPEVIEYVRGMEHIKTHTLSMIRGELRDESYKEVDLELYRGAIEKMETDLRQGRASVYRFPGARLKAAQDVLQRRLIYETMKKQRRLIPCYAGRLNIVLTEIGDVYPCELSKQRMGNIREYDYNMPRLLRSRKAQEVLTELEAHKCYCSHECYCMTNILFNPRLYGKLIKEYLSFLI
jgi:radical SAM protein with 4Fe4S-binding SPASM domain